MFLMILFYKKVKVFTNECTDHEKTFPCDAPSGNGKLTQLLFTLAQFTVHAKLKFDEVTQEGGGTLI